MRDSPDYIQKLMKERPGASASERKFQNRPRGPAVLDWTTQKKKLIFGAAGIVAVAILVFFLSGDDGRQTGNVASLKTRITTLETRVTKLEATTRKMMREQKAKTPVLSGERVGSSSRTAGGHQEALLRSIEARYHEIQAGESLSLIAEHYDLSLDQLCRLNGISPNDIVYSGQKLLVVPGH